MIFCLVMSQYLNSIFLNPLSDVYKLRYHPCILNLTETELSFQTVRKREQI